MQNQVLKTETIDGKQYDLIKSNGLCKGCVFYINENCDICSDDYFHTKCWINKNGHSIYGIFVPKEQP